MSEDIPRGAWNEGEEIAYSRAVITPYLASDNYMQQMVCLFGDPAAHDLGYEPLGLSPWAGLALAWSSALHGALKLGEPTAVCPVQCTTQMICLFGDPAAHDLGYEPLGLSPWAGLALAWSSALHL